jgi:predicted transcriptional regulator
MPVQRARAFLHELETYDDELAGRLDSELAEQATRLPAWRIRQAVRRAAQLADPDSAAQRQASRTADRGVAFDSDDDGQACVALSGPAVPLTRWYATLDDRARALRAAGDPRTLDNLRFDLAVAAFPVRPSHPCRQHHRSRQHRRRDSARRKAPAYCGDQHADAPPRSDGHGRAAAQRGGAGTRRLQDEPTGAGAHRRAVETASGLSNEPAWLDGYGWISAPTSRQLLVDAELRRLCAQTGTG